MKRYISLFLCAILLVLGVTLNGRGLTPPALEPIEYTLSQPSGESFTVYVTQNSQPPFPSGTLLHLSTVLIEEGDDPALVPSTARYMIYLAEDGYWYFAKCVEVIYRPPNDYEHPIVYRAGDSLTYADLWHGHGAYDEIYGPSGPDARVMIDPLPDEVEYVDYVVGNKLGPFDLRKTTPKEKQVMDKMIAAERERLATLQTSTAIEDPGPEAFITEPPEPVDDRSEQTAAVPSGAGTAAVTSVEEPAASVGDSAVSEPNESTAAVQSQASKRSWLPAYLIACGAVVVFAGGGVLAWRLKGRRRR